MQIDQQYLRNMVTFCISVETVTKAYIYIEIATPGHNLHAQTLSTHP
jgi:hypothetical protein